MDVLTEAGQQVDLTCLVDSFPAPTYQWEMMNRATMNFDTLTGENSTSLVFSSIQFEQYGRYRCRATTPIFDVTVTSDTALITVSPRGSVSIDPQITNSFNGSSVTLTCSAEGGPGNSFQWTYSRTGEVVSTTTQYTLTASITTGGEYQCTVTNGAGNDTDNATVNVGPIITQDPESINVTILTSDFTLTCEAIGIPVPFITWSHNDSVVNEGGVDGEFENGLFIITTEELGTIRSVLTINSALANHTGEYFCNATSTVSFYESVMSKVSLVLVQDVPERPVNVTAVEVNSRNVTLEWVEPHPNNAPILNYTVFYDLPDFFGSSEVALSTQGDEEVLLIPNLHPGENYSFTVIATNEEGDSEESELLIVRTLEEAPAGFPQNLTALTFNSTAITISWNMVLVNETNGIITQYNVTAVSDESFANVAEMLVNNSIFSVVFDGLEEFVVYRFTISARTVVGFGPTSPEVSARTNEAVPQSPPENFTVTNITANSIALEWNPPPEIDINGIIDMYVIRYQITERLGVKTSMFSLEIFNEVNIIGNTTLNTVLSDLDNYTVYMISIAAVTVGKGPVATLSQRTDENAPEAPPVFISATTVSTTAITVMWEPPPLNMTNGIIGSYQIRYGIFDRTAMDIFREINSITIEGNTTLEFNIGGLQEFIEYGFQVRAVTVAPGPYTGFAVNTTFQAEFHSTYCSSNCDLNFDYQLYCKPDDGGKFIKFKSVGRLVLIACPKTV